MTMAELLIMPNISGKCSRVGYLNLDHVTALAYPITGLVFEKLPNLHEERSRTIIRSTKNSKPTRGSSLTFNVRSLTSLADLLGLHDNMLNGHFH